MPATAGWRTRDGPLGRTIERTIISASPIKQREDRSRQVTFFRTCDNPGKLVRFSRKARLHMSHGDAEKDELADALSRIEHDAPSEAEPSAPIPPPPVAPQVPPPASAAEFRRPSRPAAPGAAGGRPAAPAPTPTPAPKPVAKP